MYVIINRAAFAFVSPKIGGLVKEFTPSDWMDGKDAKRQGRYTQLAMVATKIALEDSKVDTEKLDKVRIGRRSSPHQ